MSDRFCLPCVKCGHVYHDVKYDVLSITGKVVELLTVTCMRCRYTRPEDPLDAKKE